MHHRVSRQWGHCLLVHYVLLAAGAIGCGEGEAILPPAAIHKSAARTALTTSLDAWKNGETAEGLIQKSPAILACDDDWKAGKKLANYEIVSQADQGLSQEFRVRLVLAGSGGQEQGEASYLVSPGDVISVTRGDN